MNSRVGQFVWAKATGRMARRESGLRSMVKSLLKFVRSRWTSRGVLRARREV